MASPFCLTIARPLNVSIPNIAFQWNISYDLKHFYSDTLLLSTCYHVTYNI